MYPVANISASAGLYSLLAISSGDMYGNDPTLPLVVYPFISLARMLNPKSAILRSRASLSKIFSNFRSLWYMPLP